ncbi:MAG: hypothetical protein Q7K48_07955 [Fusobacterium sp. JB021]|nr:hypothetical protein [Fusobacterium sp. JB021]MDP0505702.1 hypothetical protein [Fusobacterium sp. JB019]
MNRKYFVKFSLEAILQVLKKYDLELKLAEKENNEEKIKLLKEEIIPKYDRLYFGLKNTNFDEKDDKEINGIEKTINDILEKNEISREYVEQCEEKREDLEGNSGAEVTKNLFLYTIRNLEKKKGNIYDKLNPIIEREKQLEAEWKECIQYEDEMKVAADIVEVREEKRNLQEQLDHVDFLINQIRYDLDCGWKYEIFGTISKEELKKNI